MGSGRRYYKVSDPSCSELCQCHIGEQLVCNVLDCITAVHCETNFAVYAHATPAFQAHRGECMCYSGFFICVRPAKGKVLICIQIHPILKSNNKIS